MKDPCQNFTKLIAPSKEKLEGDGIEISTNEIEKSAGSSPYFSYTGNLVILYISDTQKPKDYLSNNELIIDGKDKQPKFHFSACATLTNIREESHHDRYVYSRKKSGLFKVQAKEEDGEQHWLDDIKLYVCRKCLEKTNYHQYNKASEEQKTKIVKEFDIRKLFEETEGAYAPITSLPRYAEKAAPLNDYLKDWGEISRRIREEAGWHCSVCGVDMHQKKSGLHVHHKNGRKNDNSRGNLQVLCCLCHKNIEHHATMRCPKDVSDFIHRNRPKSR